MKFISKLRTIASAIKSGTFGEGLSFDEMLRMYNHYENEFFRLEEDLSFSRAESIVKDLKVFQAYLCSLNEEYKEKLLKEERLW